MEVLFRVAYIHTTMNRILYLFQGSKHLPIFRFNLNFRLNRNDDNHGKR